MKEKLVVVLTRFLSKSLCTFMSRSNNLQSFTITNLLLPKWWPFILFGKKAIFFNVLTRLLLKTLCKEKLPFLIQIFNTILQTFRILNFLLLKRRPFHYNIKVETNTFDTIFLTRLYQKGYEKSISFQYKVLKLISWSTILSRFLILNLLLLKSRPSQYKLKIEKKPLCVLFSLVFCEKLYEKFLYF